MFPWDNLADHLDTGEPIALLYVIHSEGSSPGRQGFHMIVYENGEMLGSIGGGFMEKKLVELALSNLHARHYEAFVKRQIHNKEASTNQSGMICSGEQTVAFYFLGKLDLMWINPLVNCLKSRSIGQLLLNNKGIRFTESKLMDTQFNVDILSEHQWNFEEQIGHKQSLYIVGGGHVGLALSETMSRLGFYVVLLDDRERLNTVLMNTFAHRKEIIEYGKIDEHIPESANTYVALVSFGYR